MRFTDSPALSLFYFPPAVLVALYEETDKPNNALEYPFVMYAGLQNLLVVVKGVVCQLNDETGPPPPPPSL